MYIIVQNTPCPLPWPGLVAVGESLRGGLLLGNYLCHSSPRKPCISKIVISVPVIEHWGMKISILFTIYTRSKTDTFKIDH